MGSFFIPDQQLSALSEADIRKDLNTYIFRLSEDIGIPVPENIRSNAIERVDQLIEGRESGIIEQSEIADIAYNTVLSFYSTQGLPDNLVMEFNKEEGENSSGDEGTFYNVSVRPVITEDQPEEEIQPPRQDQRNIDRDFPIPHEAQPPRKPPIQDVPPRQPRETEDEEETDEETEDEETSGFTPEEEEKILRDIDLILEAVTGNPEGLIDQISIELEGTFEGTIEGINDLVDAVTDSTSDLVDAVTDAANENTRRILDGVQSVVDGISDTIDTVLDETVGGITEDLSLILDATLSTISDTVGILGDILNYRLGQIVSELETIGQGFEILGNLLIGRFDEAVNDLSDFFDISFEEASSWVCQFLEFIMSITKDCSVLDQERA